MVPARLGRQTIPQRDALQRYRLELGKLLGSEGAADFFLNTKMKSSFPFAPVDAAAADDDVDQRKVTEGKMHIEKALGNI